MRAGHTGVYLLPEDLILLRGKAQQLNLHRKAPSRAAMAGTSHTRFRGRGMEFAEVRPYQAGDDIRTIDWRVTARTQVPHTKLFQEERERPVFILVDQRSPMFFGSQHCFKSVYAAELAAMIAWACHQGGDRLGGVLLGDHAQQDLRATRGKPGLLHFLNALVDYNQRLFSPVPKAKTLPLLPALEQLGQVVKPGSQVFLLSDFHDLDTACQESLSRMAKHSDVIALHIFDPLEADIPQGSLLRISNGFKRLLLSGSDLKVPFNASFRQQQQHLQTLCGASQVVFANCPVSADSLNPLRRLFADGSHKGAAALNSLAGALYGR
ncbi:MAG: DUF58 domain-containing protein [Marinagarivorans sp.]